MRLSNNFLPPPELQAKLSETCFSKKYVSNLPELSFFEKTKNSNSRRNFLIGASASLLAFNSFGKSKNEQLIFSPEEEEVDVSVPQPFIEPKKILRKGEIPSDFWNRPRELWLKRHGLSEQVRVVYWKDGALIPEGYWQACALLRDVRANRMTTMDPVILDVLRGIVGYYAAWEWKYPLAVTSGFRTLQTNNSLKAEGAAKNSMHLYGKAADIYMPGIPIKDIAALGVQLQQGGVGFYPAKGFTHIDTGKLRVWKG